MLRRTRRDLRLRGLKVAWFSADDDQPLAPEEWTDPVKAGLNSGPVGKLRGLVMKVMPSVVWCRSDLTPREVAETVAHEARHAWQFKQKDWIPPVAAGADIDAVNAFHQKWQRWEDERERDARDYAEKLVPVAEDIARRIDYPM
jgi:hypothetical protein